MLSAVEGKAFGELANLAGASAAEKRAVDGDRTFFGKRVRACGAANDGSGCAHVRSSLRSTCLTGVPATASLRSALATLILLKRTDSAADSAYE